MKGASFNTFLISLFIVSSLFFSIKNTTHAQSLQDLPGSDPIVMTPSPQYPRPGQTVTISLQSYAVDLQRSSITWYLDGKNVQSGNALATFSLQAGASGTSHEVAVEIVTVDGQSFTKSVTVQSGDVDLLWQASSYTPPFYEGKALLPQQGDLTIVAIPHLIENGKELDSNSLIYEWRKDDSSQKDQSGYGKKTLSIPGGFGARSTTVSLTVSSKDGKAVGVNKMTIVPSDPQVVFYEDSPLYGTVYNKILPSSFKLQTDEIRVKAVPYFFSSYSNHATDPLSFDWRINNTPIDQQGDILTLRQPKDMSGTSLISVTAANTSKLFQNITKVLTIIFNK